MQSVAEVVGAAFARWGRSTVDAAVVGPVTPRASPKRSPCSPGSTWARHRRPPSCRVRLRFIEEGDAASTSGLSPAQWRVAGVLRRGCWPARLDASTRSPSWGRRDPTNTVHGIAWPTPVTTSSSSPLPTVRGDDLSLAAKRDLILPFHFSKVTATETPWESLKELSGKR